MVKIYNRKLVRILSGSNSVQAIALGFVLLIRSKEDVTPTLLTHENIHFRQMLELLFIGFYLLYGISYIYNRWKLNNGQKLQIETRYKTNHMKAYRNNIFELEAYDHENTPDYLNNRRLYAWAKYL